MGSQIAGYFDGRQIEPGAAESTITHGYAIDTRDSLSFQETPTVRPSAVASVSSVVTTTKAGLEANGLRDQVGGQSALSEEDDSRAIRRMYEEALAAFKRKDLNAVLDHWEEDGAYLWPAVAPAIGKEEIRAAYEAFFAQWTADEIFYRHDLGISGNLAYSRFGTELTLFPNGGGPPTRMTLQGTHVYCRRPSGWKFKIVIAINVPEAQV
jgi:ketosteroid isomerase-like protein